MDAISSLQSLSVRSRPSQRLHRAAKKQRSVDIATATPNGSFRSFGLSNEISGLARNPKEKKP
jgi:hypothetical protein